MYCSISCSRAFRSPRSWEGGRGVLSFSAMRDLRAVDVLRERHAAWLDLDVVDDGPEHPPEAQLGALVGAVQLRREVDRIDARVKPPVLDAERDRHVVVARRAVEDGGEGELDVLERLDRQLVPEREPPEDEVRDELVLALARQRQRDLVGL